MDGTNDIHSVTGSQEEPQAGGQEEIQEKPSGARQRFSFRYIFGLLRNSIGAIMQGEFLIRLRFDRYFLHIIYLFFLAVVSIWIKLEIDHTMVRLEESKKELEDYKIYYAQKTCELVELDRLSTVEEMLARKGSRLTIPEKPADRISAGKTLE